MFISTTTAPSFLGGSRRGGLDCRSPRFQFRGEFDQPLLVSLDRHIGSETPCPGRPLAQPSWGLGGRWRHRARRHRCTRRGTAIQEQISSNTVAHLREINSYSSQCGGGKVGVLPVRCMHSGRISDCYRAGICSGSILTRSAKPDNVATRRLLCFGDQARRNPAQLR